MGDREWDSAKAKIPHSILYSAEFQADTKLLVDSSFRGVGYTCRAHSDTNGQRPTALLVSRS